MPDYIAFMHSSPAAATAPEDWQEFFTLARHSGMFQGGSALGDPCLLGAAPPTGPAPIAGFMRFRAPTLEAVRQLLTLHPQVRGGGAVELRELVQDG